MKSSKSLSLASALGETRARIKSLSPCPAVLLDTLPFPLGGTRKKTSDTQKPHPTPEASFPPIRDAARQACRATPVFQWASRQQCGPNTFLNRRKYHICCCFFLAIAISLLAATIWPDRPVGQAVSPRSSPRQKRKKTYNNY